MERHTTVGTWAGSVAAEAELELSLITTAGDN